MNNFIKILTLVLTLLVLPACAKELDKCEKLLDTVKTKKVQTYLLDWFDSNVGREVKKEELEFGGKYIPGQYFFKDLSFNWKTINFNEKRSMIKLLGVYPIDFDKIDSTIVESLILSERSRYGIIVKSDKNNGYGLGEDDKFINIINDRIGVLCMKRN